jgi:hypothetical protein
MLGRPGQFEGRACAKVNVVLDRHYPKWCIHLALTYANTDGVICAIPMDTEGKAIFLIRDDDIPCHLFPDSLLWPLCVRMSI